VLLTSALFAGAPVGRLDVEILPPVLPDGTRIPVDREEAARVRLLVLGHVKTRAGAPFSPRVLDADLKRLARLRRFSVRASTRVSPDGTVIVSLRVRLLPVAEEVVFSDPEGGTVSVPDEVVYALGARQGEYLNPYLLSQDAEHIRRHFLSEGYPFVGVTHRLRCVEGGVSVRFVIDTGPFVTIAAITFVGNRHFDSDALYGEIDSRVRTTLRSIFGGGYYVESRLKKDALVVRDLYRSAGFLDCRVTVERKISKKEGCALVLFRISEGERYRVGSVGTEGVSDEHEEKVRGLIETEAGKFFDGKTVSRDAERIRKYYNGKGFITAVVKPYWTVGARGSAVKVVFQVKEGPRMRLRRVLIRGNYRTRHEVIRRELTVYPGTWCDTNALRDSIQRVRRLRFLNVVGVEFLETGKADQRDLLLTLEEIRASQFNFGFTYSDVGLQGLLELVIPNFDVSGVPVFFAGILSGEWHGRRLLGAGQQLSLRLQPGRTMSIYRVRFVEPHLFGTDNRFILGPEFSRSVWTEWTHENASFLLGFGRQFSRSFLLDLTLQYKRTTITDIYTYAPRDVWEVQGTRDLHAVRLSAVFDDARIDEHFTLYSGAIMTTSGEYVGGPLGGDENFWIGRVSLQLLFPVWRTASRHHVVFSLKGVGGFAQPHDHQKKVPIFERFFIGGSTLRGFSYRHVGPREGDSHIGGTVMTLLSAELSAPVPGMREYLRCAFFLDAGNLAYTKEDYSLGDIRAAVGFGFRIQRLGAMTIRLDLAWPVRRMRGDLTQVFHFTMGANF